MDPDACFKCFVDAFATPGEEVLAQEYCRDLCQWIDRGGFEPAWSKAERAAFFAYSVKAFRNSGLS